MLTSVEPDHLDHYGGFDELVAAFDEYCANGDGGVVASADDPMAAEVGRQARRGSSSGSLPGRDFRIVDLEPAGGACRSTGARRRVGSAGSLCRFRARSSPSNAADRGRYGDRARGPVRRGAARVRPFCRRRAQVRAPGGGSRRAFRGRLRAPPDRGERCARSGAIDDRGGGWSRCSSRIVTRARGALGAVRRCVRRRRRGGRHRRVPGRGGAGAGRDREADRGCGVEPPDPAGLSLRARTAKRSRQQWPAVLRPGDLCITLGAGDLTTLPDELLGAPSW